MRRKFYIFRRAKESVYLARFTDEAGGILTERTTGCAKRDEAIFIVSNWIRDGLPPNRKRGNTPRRIEVEATLQTILDGIARADTLDADAALEIVKALRDRGLVATPAVNAKPGTVGFVAFLEKFWD
jgi:hypothetical protein